jgi:hypothetical protein
MIQLEILRMPVELLNLCDPEWEKSIWGGNVHGIDRGVVSSTLDRKYTSHTSVQANILSSVDAIWTEVMEI